MRISRNFVRALDGTLVYYETWGDGPTVALINSIGASFSFWKYFLPALRENYTLVFWDIRGHGESDFPHDFEKFDVSVIASDLECVLDAIGVDSVALVGHSTGFQVALEFLKNGSNRVKGVVDISGPFEHPLTNFLGTDRARPLAAFLAKAGLFLHNFVELASERLLTAPICFELIRHIFLNPQFAKREDFEPFLAHLAQMDYELLARLLVAFERHSGKDVLQSMEIPLLVVAGEADPFTPKEHYEKMCGLAKNCEIFWLRRGSHAVILEQPEAVNLRVEKFLQEKLKL